MQRAFVLSMMVMLGAASGAMGCRPVDERPAPSRGGETSNTPAKANDQHPGMIEGTPYEDDDDDGDELMDAGCKARCTSTGVCSCAFGPSVGRVCDLRSGECDLVCGF